MERAFCIFVICGLTACASNPNKIAPVYVSEERYSGWSCQQLSEERARRESALAEATARQQEAFDRDVRGVVSVGIPVGSISGQDISTELARLKGEKEAVDRAQAKACGFKS